MSSHVVEPTGWDIAAVIIAGVAAAIAIGSFVVSILNGVTARRALRISDAQEQRRTREALVEVIDETRWSEHGSSWWALHLTFLNQSERDNSIHRVTLKLVHSGGLALTVVRTPASASAPTRSLADFATTPVDVKALAAKRLHFAFAPPTPPKGTHLVSATVEITDIGESVYFIDVLGARLVI